MSERKLLKSNTYIWSAVKSGSLTAGELIQSPPLFLFTYKIGNEADIRMHSSLTPLSSPIISSFGIAGF